MITSSTSQPQLVLPSGVKLGLLVINFVLISLCSNGVFNHFEAYRNAWLRWLLIAKLVCFTAVYGYMLYGLFTISKKMLTRSYWTNLLCFLVQLVSTVIVFLLWLSKTAMEDNDNNSLPVDEPLRPGTGNLVFLDSIVCLLMLAVIFLLRAFAREKRFEGDLQRAAKESKGRRLDEA